MQHKPTQTLVRALRLLAVGAACALLGTTGYAQVRATGFRAPEFYDAPHQTQVKTLSTGEEALPQSDGTILIKGFKIETFRESGEAEMIMTAPQCVLNRNNRTAGSPGPIQIHSGDGKLQIAGEGFLWGQTGTNSTLAISNKVHTTVLRELLAQSSGAKTNAASGTSQPLQIDADHFTFDREANLITYNQNVRAEDNKMNLACDVMTIQGSTNRTVNNIVADRNVVITDKATGGQATGERAVYSGTEGKQVMELTGNPHWQEGLREGTGKVFVFDRAHNTLRAEGDAYWKLPRESVSQSGLTLFSQSNGETNAAATTGTNFVEIYADDIMLQLPPTNGPVQSVTAEKRVVIVDRLKNSRATGGRAYYAESSGILELTENALWQADQRIAKGDALIFDRNNKIFSARTNAYMKFPVAALGRSSPLGDTTAGGTSATTNQFIEVAANAYDYQGDRLTFRDQVQAGFAEGEVIRGTLECATLKVGFSSNQLQTIEAKTEVYARQLPIMDVRGRTVEKELKCEQLNVRMRTNGLVEEIVAERNVMTSQTETRTNRPLPVRLTLNSETMTAKFLTYTNQVETVVADRQVVITSAEKTAHGEKAVYTGTNDIAELSGHPMLEGTNFTMTAETIVLDHGKGKYYGRKNVKITTELHAGNMSKTNLFGKPKVKAP